MMSGARSWNDGTAASKARAVTARDDARLVDALRAGNEDAFTALIDRYQASLIRLAMLYVPNRAAAEDVVQETWLGVLQGIDRFEARSALKTWLFRILVNRAKRRGARDHRIIPFSTAWNPELEIDEAAVEPDRFFPAGHRIAGHWSSRPAPWDDLPENHLLTHETRVQIEEAISGLPPSQREVITLRDVEGWEAAEVCNALGLSETNQRVLLHRARSKVRRALAQYLAGG